MTIDLKEKWKYTQGYFAVLFLFWAISLIIWMYWGYKDSFRILNEYHWGVHDSASLYFFTHLADGVILPAILILWMWKKDPALVITGIIAIYVTGILTQTGKMTVFDSWNRPPAVFDGVSGVEIFAPHPPKRHSFPSGHATSFATGGIFFAYFLSKWQQWMGIVVGGFTIFLCYTRVTIGVHFPGDIFVGSIVGSVGAFLILLYLYPRLKRWVEKRNPDKWAKATPYVLGFAVVGLLAQFIHLISRI